MLALTCLAFPLAFLQPPHPSQWGVQRWELPTLRERIHKGSVAKVGIHSSQLAVEVLDVNGIQRRVDIFPEATPVLIQDMREAHVGFTVIQDREPTGLEVFLYSFTVTMLIIWVIGALGLMEDLVWGLAIAGMSLYSAIAELNSMIDEGLIWLEAAITDGQMRLRSLRLFLLEALALSGPQAAHDQMIPVPIEVEDRLDN